MFAHVMPMPDVGSSLPFTPPGSKVSLRDVLQGSVVQGQVRHEALELGVFALKLLEPLHFRILHAAVLVAPAVIGLLGGYQPLGDLGRRQAARMQHLCIARLLLGSGRGNVVVVSKRRSSLPCSRAVGLS